MELIDEVINLLNHYKSCTCCNSGVLAGILAPSLIDRLTTLDKTNGCHSHQGPNVTLARQCSELKSVMDKIESIYLSDTADVLKASDRSNQSELCIVSSLDEDDDVSLVSVSTTPGIVDNSFSEISSNPFSLPSISSQSKDLNDVDKVEETVDKKDTSKLSDKLHNSDLEISVSFDSQEIGSDLKDELSSLCITNGSSIEENNEQELILSSTESETRNTLPPKSSTVLATKLSAHASPIASPVGRKALRNAVINKSVTYSHTGKATCPDKVYYRSNPSDTSTHCNKEAVYTNATTSDINHGKLWRKHVELQGKVTRCYTVPSSDSTQHNLRIKLLGFTDSQGVTQVTLRGDLPAQYEDMVKAGTISVKGVCERKVRKSKYGTSQYEVITQSWSELPELPELPDKENNSSEACGPVARFSAHDIRYTPSDPRINVTVRKERSRTVQRASKGSTQLSVTRTFSSQPPPLVPVENRTTLTTQYSPTFYLSEIPCNNTSSIVTWGTLTNATSSSATLVNGDTEVKLYFTANYKTDSTLVLVEGTPFYDNVNNKSIAVLHIDELYYKHLPCVKFLASYGTSQSGTRTGKKIEDLPKIIDGGDLKRYRGKFVLMRAKLIHLQLGQKKSRGRGRVICGDGVTVHFSVVPFSNKYRNITVGDQVVLIGKVDYGNNRTTANEVPWLTLEHLQVIPDKETDTVLGFPKSAIYEALKQIVLETLKNDDRALDRDPWSFLND